MSFDMVTAGLNFGTKLVERLVQDPAQKAAAQLELLKLVQHGELAPLIESAGIVRAEAQSEHKLAATWRPIVMLTFAGLIVARWFGFAAPDLSETEYLKLWDIVEFGLGGYVVGRSVEKTVPALAAALKTAVAK